MSGEKDFWLIGKMSHHALHSSVLSPLRVSGVVHKLVAEFLKKIRRIISYYEAVSTDWSERFNHHDFLTRPKITQRFLCCRVGSVRRNDRGNSNRAMRAP